MPGPGMIDAYLQALHRRLPAEVVDELADGLAETYDHFLSQGLAPQEAAHAAIADFGPPAQIVAAFRRNAPGRRFAARLLATGPLVGGCWAAALWTDPFWHALPLTVRLALPLLLLSVIALLAVAWRGPYGRIRGSARTAGVGLIAIDTGALILLILAVLTAPTPGLLLGPAACASLARIAFTSRHLPALAPCE